MKCTLQANKPVTGLWADSTFGGIEIIGDIEYTPDDDYVYWRFNYGTPTSIRRAKIYYGTNPHFRTPHGRIYFKDIQRV